jgi:glyoxylase-like metal-dependent hydrolase (beta-lactamase superfamily II)/rhodanese-related sulfurtransferase
MIFEQVQVGGCRSYLIGCSDSSAAVLIDPEISALDRYRGLIAQRGLVLHYVIDTHTHADHFSGAREIAAALDARIVMGRESPAPYIDLRIDDGDALIVGKVRLQALATPGHTRDSMCYVAEDRIFTGDTLLIGGTGRSDLPTGDPDQLYESLFERVLKLDPKLLICPAHEYKNRDSTAIAQEIADNPRLQTKERAAFVAMMNSLNLAEPTHLTEALRVNMSGKKSVAQMLAEAAAAVPFVSLGELSQRIARRQNDVVILDVRERDAYEAGHVPGALWLARGQLELRVNDASPDPTVRILVYCEFGKISTLAAATLRALGFSRAAALDGGMKAWREGDYPIETGA